MVLVRQSTILRLEMEFLRMPWRVNVTTIIEVLVNFPGIWVGLIRSLPVTSVGVMSCGGMAKLY